MTQPKNERRAARGLTLTELLVVIAIIVLVSGAMLPTIRPLLKGRNVREASRIVNVFFAGVQAQAIEKQRPMGVWLERAAHDDVLNGVPLQPNHYKVNKLYVAEQPAPYTGDSLDARARVITAFDQNGPNPAENAAIAEFIPQGPLAFQIATVVVPFEDCSFYSILQVGELIRFNHRGGLYRIIETPNGATSVPHDPGFRPPFNRSGASAAMSAGTYVAFRIQAVESDVPIGFASLARLQRGLGRLQGQTVPFQIYRRPKRSIAAPIEMPNGTTIDLMLSGIDGDNATKFRYLDGTEVLPGHDVVIMFDEFGKPDQVHYMVHDPLVTPTLWSSARDINSSISLFIGRDELVGQDGNKTITPPGMLTLETTTPLVNAPAFENWSEANLRDTTNIWLTIDSTKITTIPNAGFDPSITQFPLTETPIDFFDFYIRHARQLTRSGLSMGEQ